MIKTHRLAEPTGQSHVLYIGGYLDSRIVARRRLPTHNSAGTNRQRRLATALSSAGMKPLILSPAIAIRLPWHTPFWHPSEVHRVGKVPVIFAPALGVPLLGYVLEGFLLLGTVYGLLRNRSVATAILYDFPPSFILVALFLRIRGIQIIHNVEDVSRPCLKDWFPGSEGKAFKQTVAYFGMAFISRLAHGLLVPTRRFLPFLPNQKPYLVITGCDETFPSDIAEITPGGPIRFLYSGVMDNEHGIFLILEAVKHLAVDVSPLSTLHLDLTGYGPLESQVRNFLNANPDLPITFHGFVSSTRYQTLLLGAHVCLALQNPNGRYAQYKTPSKAYEFISAGKAVIATDVGDLDCLSPGCVVLLPQWDSTSLADLIRHFSIHPDLVANLGRNALTHARTQFDHRAVGQRMAQWFSSIPGWRPTTPLRH